MGYQSYHWVRKWIQQIQQRFVTHFDDSFHKVPKKDCQHFAIFVAIFAWPKFVGISQIFLARRVESEIFEDQDCLTEEWTTENFRTRTPKTNTSIVFFVFKNEENISLMPCAWLATACRFKSLGSLLVALFFNVGLFSSHTAGVPCSNVNYPENGKCCQMPKLWRKWLKSRKKLNES